MLVVDRMPLDPYAKTFTPRVNRRTNDVDLTTPSGSGNLPSASLCTIPTVFNIPNDVCLGTDSTSVRQNSASSRMKTSSSDGIDTKFVEF